MLTVKLVITLLVPKATARHSLSNSTRFGARPMKTFIDMLDERVVKSSHTMRSVTKSSPDVKIGMKQKVKSKWWCFSNVFSKTRVKTFTTSEHIGN